MSEVVFAPARVVDLREETAALSRLTLDLGLARDAYKVPGQVVRLRAAGAAQDGYFAVASGPRAERMEFLIKRGGAVADEVLLAAKGAGLESCAPFGKGFPIERALGHDVLLFAAGSGIAPVRALVEELIARDKEVGKISLYYGQRFEADFAFVSDFARWRKAGVDVVACCTRPGDTWKGAHGRVQEVAAQHRLDEGRAEKTVAFLCGMKQMVLDTRAVLAQLGVSEDRTFLNF